MRVLAAFLLITACNTRLSPIDGELSVEPRALAFDATATGDSRAQKLTLTNASRAPLDLHASAPAPFTLEIDLRLAGGESRALDVTFTPSALGASSAVLQVSGDVALDVPLSGTGIEPAVCTAASSCRTSQRDPATNTCTETNAPDGTSCSGDNACLMSGQCLAGVCVGSAKSCDDSNRCTIDACEPVGGCAHFDATCPEPADKCQVAVCDPQTGCGTAPAADGTSCGPSDCTTAHVCMSGTCRALAVPDGYACGESSPCRPRGRCSQGTCNQSPATDLQEAWSRTLAYDADFRGVTDAAGNLYWVECFPVRTLAPCELVSVSSSGLQRFRASLSSVPAPGGTRHLWSQGRLIVASRSGSVGAYSDVSGAQLWSASLGGALTTLSLAADAHGQLWVATHFEGESESWGVTSLDAATGATRTARVLSGPPSELVLDAQDNVYFHFTGPHPFSYPANPDGGSWGNLSTEFLVSLSSLGAPRFQVALSNADVPRAVFNGELLMRSGAVRSTIDGSQRVPAGADFEYASLSPLMSSGLRYRWRLNDCCPTCDCDDELLNLELEGYPAGSGTLRFSWGPANGFYPPHVSEPTLLGDGSALFASEVPATARVELRSIDSTGAQKFACSIGSATQPYGSSTWLGPAALTAGRWVVVQQDHCFTCVHDPAPVLRAYEAGGLTLAASGWTGLMGTPGRTGGPK